MAKIFNKKGELSLLKISLAFAVIYSIVFCGPLVKFYYSNLNQITKNEILELSKQFVAACVFLVLIFRGLSFHRYLFWGGSFVLNVIGIISIFYLQLSNSLPTARSYISIITAPHKHFSDIYFTCLFAIFTVIWVQLIRMYKIPNNYSVFNSLVTMLCLLFTGVSIIDPNFDFMANFFPIIQLHDIYNYIF